MGLGTPFRARGSGSFIRKEMGSILVGDDKGIRVPESDRIIGIPNATYTKSKADMIRQRTREGIAARQNDSEYHHGPAPIGFEKAEGELIEGDYYQQVCAALEMVQKGELSKRRAATELGTSRKTITRALGRPELYGLTS